jgi:hypothetical protein
MCFVLFKVGMDRPGYYPIQDAAMCARTAARWWGGPTATVRGKILKLNIFKYFFFYISSAYINLIFLMQLEGLVILIHIFDMYLIEHHRFQYVIFKEKGLSDR